jgi:hypothetical protein
MAKAKKKTKAPAASKPKKKPAPSVPPKKKAAAKVAAPAKRSTGGKRMSWLDAKKGTPQIEQYARQLTSFLEAMADGIIEESEVKAQEQRLVELMREVEPQLDDDLHERVTQLLCELTAYDLMQVMSAMHAARPKSRFRG